MTARLELLGRVLMAAGLAAWLAACGGGGGEEAAPAPPAPTAVAGGQQATQTVGAAGGSVVLNTREGAVFTLAVPAGAVPEGTAISLQTATPATGRRLHLRLSPAGLVPAEPLVLTLSLPASMALPAGAAVVYDRVPLAATRRADGRVELRLPALAAGTATAGDVAWPLARRQQASAPTAACQGVPVLADTPEGGLADSAPIVSDDYGSCMLGAVNALAVSGQFAEAVRLASAIGAYLQSIGAANTDGLSTRFLTEARSLACTAYGQALDTVASATITDFGTLPRVVRPLLFWRATIEKLGAVCPGIAPTRYVEVIEELTTDAMVFFSLKRGAVVDPFSVEYTEAVATVRAAPATVAELRSLQASAPVQALARAQLQERAQPAVVDAVLQAPWQRCRDSGNFDKLIELMEQANKPAAVKTAAQYCGTLLLAQAKNAAGAVTATLSPSLGGVSAGNQRTSGSIDVAKDGTLVLSGPIRALQCPAGSAGGSESLQIKLGSTVLQTISAAPHLASDLVIDIAQALQAAGISASSFTGATLTLSRSGSPCGGFWGDNPEPLLTINLTSGLCAPEVGRNYCVTVLSALDGSERDFHLAHAISNQGGHVYLTGQQGVAKPSVWQRGRATALPDGFEPWVNGGGGQAVLAVADDGALLGWKPTFVNGLLTQFMPALFKPGEGRLVDLLPNALKAFELDLSPTWASYRLTRQLWTMTLSPQGRITFTLIENDDRGWADSDLGLCGLVQLSSGTGYDCFRYTRYEASSAGNAPATAEQTLRAPNTGELQFPTFDGGTGVGRVGHADELVAQTGVGGGISSYPQRFTNSLARDLVTTLPKVAGDHYAADRHGRTVALLRSGETVLQPATGAVPAGWSVGSLGIEGHLQVCSADGATTRLVELGSGRTLVEIAADATHRHQGRVLQLRSGCAAWARLVDAQGRLLGSGWIESEGREVPVIYTPAGVALP